MNNGLRGIASPKLHNLALSGRLKLPNAGLHVADIDASHDLVVKPGSNLTAERILSLLTGDADRILSLLANVILDQSVDTASSPAFVNEALAGYLELSEIASPANPAADKLRLFAKDVAGVTKAYIRDAAGTETDLGSSGGGSNPWTLVSKPSDEARSNNATLANDGALLVPMLASTNYLIRGEVFYNTNGTADFQFSFGGPASPTLVNIAHWGIDPDGSLSGGGTDEVYGVATQLSGSVTPVFGFAKFTALIRNGGNAGNFAFQWAQGTSNAGATTVRAGSYLEHKTV